MHHESEANVRVETRLLRHDRVIPSLPDAAKHGDTPDLHFLWNGIYHIEHAWDGLLEPLEQFFDTGQVAALTGGPQSRFRGQTFRAGWYLIPVVWVVNLEVLAEAGVEAVPDTWEQLVEACQRLKSAKTPAIVGGDGEGDLSVWWLTHLLTQMLDRGTDVAQFALGDRSWQAEPYCKAWYELHRFVREGWIDRASLPLTLWDAFVRFSEGVGAFTLASGPMFVRCRESLGDRVALSSTRRGLGYRRLRPLLRLARHCWRRCCVPRQPIPCTANSASCPLAPTGQEVATSIEMHSGHTTTTSQERAHHTSRISCRSSCTSTSVPRSGRR
jgi:hypothetical protein